MKQQRGVSKGFSTALKFTLVILVASLIGCVGYTYYRQYYLKDYTEKSLGTISVYVKDGSIKDYRNVLGVQSVEDITYTYDRFFRVYKIYFGNYAIYLTEEESSWSPEALQSELGRVGLTFKREDGFIVFYFNNEELRTPDWRN